jgi:hypothetical protein
MEPPPAVRGATGGRANEPKETFMPKQPKHVRLSRETLRHLDGGSKPGGPVGTEPNTDLPNNCYTASCRPHIC